MVLNQNENILNADMFEKGLFWIARKNHEFALDALLVCHRNGFRAKEIEDIIRNNCYRPWRSQHEENYRNNIELLRNYPHISLMDYPGFNQLDYEFIPYSSSNFIVFDRKKGEYTSNFDSTINLDFSELSIDETCFFIDEFRTDNIVKCEEITRDPAPYLWSKVPLFLYYNDQKDFIEFLQLIDLKPILEPERAVFLFGMAELKQHFQDLQAMLPSRLFNVQPNDEILEFFHEHHQYIKLELDRINQSLDAYYGPLGKKEILANLQNRKPRILFHTCLFTTALQYFVRDCVVACDNLGIPNKVLIEKSNIHRVSNPVLVTAIDEFKPDIVFLIDHFRTEFTVPDNVIYVSWIQDLINVVTAPETPASIGPLDFILNAFISDRRILLDLGYPNESIIEGSLSANPNIYKKYDIDREEERRYSSDICLFSNAGNPETGLKTFLEYVADSPIYPALEKLSKEAYREMYEAFYNEQIIYSQKDFKAFLARCFEINNITANDTALNYLADRWRDEVGFRILRSIPIEWLHERGYNMKIWGSEWLDHPLLHKYAQGVAANGETLSRIINCSKIVLGTNPAATLHPRVFETIMSDSFYIAYGVPEEDDVVNIRPFLKEDQEIVFAHSREDLYQKIDYYLENETARQKIVRAGKEKIMASLTYEVMMTRLLDEIKQKLQERGDA